MPNQAISPRDSRSYLGYALQSAKGTPAAPSFFATFVDVLEMAPNMQPRKVREAGQALYAVRHLKDSYLPAVSGGAPVRPDESAALMAFFLGLSPAPSGAGPYTHTITANELTRWLTFERNIADDLVERMVDAFIVEMTLDIRKRDNGGPEAMLAFTAGSLDIEGDTAVNVDSYETDTPFLRSDATWTIDAAGATNIESATLTLRWTFDEGILADAITRDDAVKMGLDGTIEIVSLYSDPADKANYLATHYASGAVSEFIQSGDFNVTFNHTRGGGGAEQRQFQVDIPEVDWINAVIDSPNPEGSEALRIRRTGEMMSNANVPITVTAINGRSAAYIA